MKEKLMAVLEVSPAMVKAGLDALNKEGGVVFGSYEREDELAMAHAFVAMLCASKPDQIEIMLAMLKDAEVKQ